MSAHALSALGRSLRARGYSVHSIVEGDDCCDPTLRLDAARHIQICGPHTYLCWEAQPNGTFVVSPPLKSIDALLRYIETRK